MSVSKRHAAVKLEELRVANQHVTHVTSGPHDQFIPDGTSIERGQRSMNSHKKDLKRKLRTLHNESVDGQQPANMYEDRQTPSLVKIQQNSHHVAKSSFQYHQQHYNSAGPEEMLQMDSDVMFASEITAERSGMSGFRERRSTMTESKVSPQQLYIYL